MTEPLNPPAGERDRREQAERLFAEACALPAEARIRFIEQACGADAELRAELGSLIAHADAAEQFFGHLADAMIPAELPPSATVGRYEILACIGVGGMGAVYRAWDTRLHRDVALKFLPAHLGAALDAEERLLIEARAAAVLEHANVCTVHEIAETEDGRPFIAMAFYEGETLKERLRRAPLPAAEAVEIAVQVARGLGAAHAHGIVHRDVKPGNIMLTPGGTVKLLDFGLAKVADVSLTRPGVTPGTVAYMSPEQARGDPVGPRSDLWSLGVVLHEMLTGVHPFRGGNDRAVIQAILHSTPEALRKRKPDAPRSLERTLDRMLQKESDTRYASTDELLLDLTQVTSSTTGPRSLPFRVPSSWRRRRALLAVGAAVLAVLGGTAVWLDGHGASPVTATTVVEAPAGAANGATADTRAIAVLPFTNLSRDPEEYYFSDGVTEELIGVLSQVRALRVAARTSAFAFKGGNHDVRDIGRALGVGAVLEGSVRKEGERFRVTAHLVDAATGFHLWSDTYEREGTDIFAIQSELALRIASALEAELTTAERERIARRPTENAEAYALFLKGRHFWNQRTEGGMVRAIEYYERAIAADPRYAAAYAGLATAYSIEGLYGYLVPGEARERMRKAAFEAVELDGDLAEAHAALGAYLHVYEWDSDASEREYLHAIELDPSYSTVRHFYGNLLHAVGRLEEAVAQKTKAVELDPLAPMLTLSLGRTLLLSGRRDEAHEHFRNILELDSTIWVGHTAMGSFYEATGRLDEAILAFGRALGRDSSSSRRADLARVLALTGDKDEARRMLAALEAEATRTGIHHPHIATVHLALDDVEAAIAWLEQSYRERHPQLRFIGGEPNLAPLENDPRFVDLLRRLGLPSL